LTVTLFNREGEVVEIFTSVKFVDYDEQVDRFIFGFESGGFEKVWANGGSLKVEG